MSRALKFVTTDQIQDRGDLLGAEVHSKFEQCLDKLSIISIRSARDLEFFIPHRATWFQ